MGIDRGFYRPLAASEYERLASQVPAHFRFTVKAPSLVTDAVLRREDGRGQAPNPCFLDPTIALREFIEPACEGLGARIGALVFQISPLPAAQLARMDEAFDRLHALLLALPRPPAGVIAVEVRNAEWLETDLIALLRDTQARYCLGLHPKLPPLARPAGGALEPEPAARSLRLRRRGPTLWRVPRADGPRSDNTQRTGPGDPWHGWCRP